MYLPWNYWTFKTQVFFLSLILSRLYFGSIAAQMYGLNTKVNKKQTIIVKFILVQLILFLLYLYAHMNISI